MFLRVLGSYGMRFVSGLKPGRILLNFPQMSPSEKRKTWSHQHDSKNRYYYRFFSQLSPSSPCIAASPVLLESMTRCIRFGSPGSEVRLAVARETHWQSKSVEEEENTVVKVDKNC